MIDGDLSLYYHRKVNPTAKTDSYDSRLKEDLHEHIYDLSKENIDKINFEDGVLKLYNKKGKIVLITLSSGSCKKYVWIVRWS